MGVLTVWSVLSVADYISEPQHRPQTCLRSNHMQCAFHTLVMFLQSSPSFSWMGGVHVRPYMYASHPCEGRRRLQKHDKSMDLQKKSVKHQKYRKTTSKDQVKLVSPGRSCWLQILGNKSLKIKYLNPSTVFIASGPPTGMLSEDMDSSSIMLTVQILDTVTGAPIYRQVHKVRSTLMPSLAPCLLLKHGAAVWSCWPATVMTTGPYHGRLAHNELEIILTISL